MIFQEFRLKILQDIDVSIFYRCETIEIDVRWSQNDSVRRYSIDYLDEDSTIPDDPPLFYLCSCSAGRSLNPSFYSYWFVLEKKLFLRLFSKLISNPNSAEFVLLICLNDGRIVSLGESESSSELRPFIWFRSSTFSAPILLGLNFDSNKDFLAAISSNEEKNSIFSKGVFNHFLVVEKNGSLLSFNETSLRRILLDHSIRSVSLHSNNFLYLTENQLKSISIANLLQSSNENILRQIRTLRFANLKKIFTGKISFFSKQFRDKFYGVTLFYLLCRVWRCFIVSQVLK